METFVSELEAHRVVEKLDPTRLLEEIEHWSTALDVMAAISTTDGALLFSNTLFRTFFCGIGSDLREIDPLQIFFGTERSATMRVRMFSYQERSLLAVEIPFPMVASQKALLFLILDVDSRILEGEEFRAMKERMELLEVILDASAEGLMFVNRDGIITYINRSYEEIHKVKAENVIGRHVTEIIENTRMHLVVKTGIPEVTEFQLESLRRYIVSRIPVFKNGLLIGAIGKIIFRDIDSVEQLASKVDRLKTQLEYYRTRLDRPPDTRYSADDIVGVSPSSAATKATALRVAPTDATVLLLGESGVGKEVYAQAIHAMSLRARGPFVRLNCSAIVESLFESELFGYAEGAFTGASKGGKLGKFELANFGTIFLDEIADMPLESQAKLLRVLQEREVERLGGVKQVKIDVRVIAATNQNLPKLVEEGKFRKDLYFRINVIPITIPALRDRTNDVPALVHLFWEQLKREHGVYYHGLSNDALSLLQTYSWPGNVRELRNVLERAISIVRGDTITAEHLRVLLLGGVARDECATIGDCDLRMLVEIAERRAISTALARCNNNRAQAAKVLGITRPLLYKKMHTYGIQ
jgi:transcriptional regulator with PAS, ATPase and Fis domain